MKKINYITRENNTQKVYLTEGTLNVVDILNENYPYICNSIKKEAFSLKSDECNLFKELVFDGKVVGFCSYDFSREFMTAALNNIYVMPEFRGNNLFKEELEKTLKEHNKPSIVEPTRFVVELLIEYGFAKKITETIVASSIEFVVPGEHIESNKIIKTEEELSTHFYDLNICASIHILNLNENIIAYSLPLNDDIKRYDCIDARLNILDDYFEELRNLFTGKEDEILQLLVDLEEKLPLINYTLEEIIGRENEFSPYIETLIDDAHTTRSQALEIKKQIKEEYEAGMLLNESLLIRLAYLFENPEEPRLITHEEICPYCNMPVDNHDRYCHYCGINLNYDANEIENNLINSINQFDSEINTEEDIRYIAYKFLKTIYENIEFEYAIFMTENNFNIEFDALKRYLDENNYIKNKKITDEGINFLKNHPLHYYEKYNMDIINYNDFEEYFWKNTHLDGAKICLKFLEEYPEDSDISEIKNEIKRNN